MKTKELIEYLEKTPGDKLTKADEEIIQHLLELDELKEKIKELKLFLDDVSKYVA